MSSGGRLLPYADVATTLTGVRLLGTFTETWFKSIIVSLSSLWLIWRVYQVSVKPVTELIALLGLEVPAQPEVSLAGIRADGVTLHWKPGDGSVTRWQVATNGVSIGDVNPKETSITVYGLKPGHSYTARLVAHNAHFQTASPPVRFTTLPAVSKVYYHEPKDDANTEDDCQDPTHPMLRPAKTLFEVAQLPTPVPMAREHSSSVSQRRHTQTRHVSPIFTDAQSAPGDDHSDAVRDLTSRLETLRRENEEAERQEREEQDEFETTRKALDEERDRYRKQLKEKDDTSRDLKKEVTRLERANTSVQGSKNNAERKLQNKHNDRQKMKDDLARWDGEVEDMKQSVKKLLEQKELLEKETGDKLDAFRDQLAREQDANKTLEEDIKDKSMHIKTLEHEKRKDSDDDVHAPLQPSDALDEEERAFDGRLRSLQYRYTESYQMMMLVQGKYAECQQNLLYLQQRRQSVPHAFASTPILEAPPRRQTSLGRQRAGSVLGDMQSPTPAAFGAIGSASANSHSVSSVSPSFNLISPRYFNTTNGMTLDHEQLEQPEQDEMTEADRADMTAGAPMSPSTAGALLPSNLFGDDATSTATSDAETDALTEAVTDANTALTALSENDPPKPTFLDHRRILTDDVASLHQNSNRNSAALPGLGVLPGLGAASSAAEPTDNKAPSSPTSADSRSPSFFASPGTSMNHLPHRDSWNEIDRRSIRSNTNSSMGGGKSRFFGLGSLARHRAGKPSQDEGPALGTLKNSQTQSMPRQDLSEHGTDAKRRGSHSGGSGWMGMPSISQAFSRSSKDAEVASLHTNELARPSRLRPFTFGKSAGDNPWLTSSLLSRSSVPRPASTHSSDNTNMLPRPDTGNEMRFGWPVDGASDRQVISPLSVDWAVDPERPSAWSRQPSRRPSVQYGSSAINPEMMYYETDQPARQQSLQAPIGTRPQTSHGQNSGSASGKGTDAPPTPNLALAKPSLNPAAPSFSFSFLRSSKKNDEEESNSTPKSEKKKDKKNKGKDKDTVDSAPPSTSDSMLSSSLETPKATAGVDSTSPPESRKSKDTRSISTADGSFLDSSIASMPRTSDSLERSQSRTPSESQQGQGQLTPLGSRENMAKESFMQKLSRKTSQTGSKLSRPFSFSARGKSAVNSPALDARDGTPGLDEGEEDLSRSVESIHFGGGAGSVTGSPIVRPSLDGAEEGEGRRGKGRAKSGGWSSLKLSRREKKKAEAAEVESVTASEADTADEDGEEGYGILSSS